jgi:hypothetical protein
VMMTVLESGSIHTTWVSVYWAIGGGRGMLQFGIYDYTDECKMDLSKVADRLSALLGIAFTRQGDRVSAYGESQLFVETAELPPDLSEIGERLQALQQAVARFVTSEGGVAG